jgi:ADP-heptose:LPS heptosyltransferase
MKKILIFKSDRIGDLINISSIIKNLKHNFDNSEITFVCSKYNSDIAKYYPEISSILIFENSIIKFILRYFDKIFFNKYDYIFQLDGKKKSYFLTAILKSKFKSCLHYIKQKRILSFDYTLKRPNFFISLFYDYLIECNEKLDEKTNQEYHYLTLYLKILKKYNLMIITNEHYLPFDGIIDPNFTNYFHIHIDERWNKFDINFYNKFLNSLLTENNSKKYYITSNVNGNIFFKNIKNNLKKRPNIKFNENASIRELINIIYNCHTSLSNHTGLTVHVAASFKKNIIDIVSPELDLHYDRWIPFNINYKRYNINNFTNIFI